VSILRELIRIHTDVGSLPIAMHGKTRTVMVQVGSLLRLSNVRLSRGAHRFLMPEMPQFSRQQPDVARIFVLTGKMLYYGQMCSSYSI
jgi:hypothetical protein